MEEVRTKQQWKEKPLGVRENAKRQISELLTLSLSEKNPALARRYVALALRISQKYKVKIPTELKGKFCKKCYSPLIPGRNLRVRLRKGRISYFCLNCGNIKRHPYLKEQKESRRLRKI
ncbi:MAG: ribonuclease P protein component 4 [Candidatus Woesearchaeota archaeon]